MHSSADVTALVLDTVAYYVRIGLCLAGFAFLLIFLGVVLPAVWSLRPDRRQAATEILTYLLNAAGSSVAVNQHQTGADQPGFSIIEEQRISGGRAGSPRR